MIEPDTSVQTAPARYSTVAMVLHWLIAALLIFEVGLGLRMEAASGSAKFAIFQLHKSVGITILLLVALRLVWRFYKTPPLVAARGWERVLANAVHALFYLLLFALPISGWIIVSTSKIVVPTLLYGAVPWPHFPGLEELAGEARTAWNAASEFVHVNLVNLLYLLFALHLAGALKHHFLDRDGDIARMVPGTRAGRWFDPRLIAIGIGVLGFAGLGFAWLPIGTTRPTAQATVSPASSQAPSVAPVVAAPEPAAAAEPEIANAAEAVDEKMELSTWTIGKGSSLRFRTSWSGEAISGGFNRFDGTIDFSPDVLEESRAEIRIETASVFSGDDQRDETLKSGEWFATGAHGTAIFRASRFRKTGANSYVVSGTLTLKGMTLPIALPFTLKFADDRATMQGTATVDRTAYKIGEGEYASTSEIPANVMVSVRINAIRRP